MKTYFVRYSTGKYDGDLHAELDDIAKVEALLSKYATNPEFTFDVVYGERVEFKPVEVVTAYRVVE